jgi:GNAT superfamily N-acetyltransferase
MSEDITLRMAKVDDALVIAHHRRAMFSDAGHTDASALDAMDAAFVPYVRRALADRSYRGWLAVTSESRVVAGGGLIVHEWPATPRNTDTQRAYILNVYTEPEYRWRGIARRIMNAILDFCRTEGFHSVSLHASEQGRAMYISMGFEQTNEMRLRLQPY